MHMLVHMQMRESHCDCPTMQLSGDDSDTTLSFVSALASASDLWPLAYVLSAVSVPIHNSAFNCVNHGMSHAMHTRHACLLVSAAHMQNKCSGNLKVCPPPQVLR